MISVIDSQLMVRTGTMMRVVLIDDLRNTMMKGRLVLS